MHLGVEGCDQGTKNADNASCTSACQVASCGDGLVRTGFELCDDGNQVSGDGCEADCTTVPVALWTRTVNDTYNAVALDALGNPFVAGATQGATGWDLLVTKYDPNGNVLWTSSYAGIAGGTESGYTIAVDSSGDAVVAGIETLADGTRDALLAKLSGSTGALLWRKTYGGSMGKNDQATSVAVNASGDIYVGGVITNYQPVGHFPGIDEPDLDIFLYKVRGTDGATLIKTEWGNVDDRDFLSDLTVDSTGAILYVYEAWLTPAVGPPLVTGYVDKAYDLGASFDFSPLGGADMNHGQSAIISDANGNVITVGGSYFGYGLAVSKYGSSWNQLWMSTSPVYYPWACGTSVAALSNGEIIVAGLLRAAQGKDTDWMVRRYSASGIELSTQLWGVANLNEGANDVVVDGADAIYVVGYEETASSVTRSVLRKLPPP